MNILSQSSDQNSELNAMANSLRLIEERQDHISGKLEHIFAHITATFEETRRSIFAIEKGNQESGQISLGFNWPANIFPCHSIQAKAIEVYNIQNLVNAAYAIRVVRGD